jgi:Histidine kinase
MQKKIVLITGITLLTVLVYAQNKGVDSMKAWVNTHTAIDSAYILTLHRISYRLSEKDVKQSFTYYEKVVSLSDSINFIYGKALAQINLGILLYNSANFDASNKAYFKAIGYADDCNAPRLKAVALNNIADNLKTLKDFEKSRKYIQEAIDLNIKLEAWRGVAINYELLQQCDLEEKLFKNAKVNLIKGMTYALKTSDSYILSLFYLGFGKLQAINNKRDSAEYYFDKALQEARLESDLRNELQVYLARVKYFTTMPAGKKISLLDSALRLAKQTDYLEGVANTAQQLSAVYDELNNKDSSLVFYRIYRSAADSLFSENNKRNVIIQESEWQLKRKEIENTRLKGLAALQQKDLVVKNSLLLAALTVFVLALAIAAFVYKNNQAKKKRTEAHMKQKIAEVEMKVLRAQMNPHFIFNSLNSIENFMMQNEKRLASDYLNKFTRLIRTILDSSLSDLIPVTKDMEALQLYIDLQQLRFNNKFTYKTNIDPLIVNGDYKVPSLIVQPFVENAIEHGIAHSEKHDCTLSVSAMLNNDFILYTIEDNGIGREQAAAYNMQNKKQHKSLGISITKDRIHIFNDTVKSVEDVVITDLYDDKQQPAGTRVEVKIKLL